MTFDYNENLLQFIWEHQLFKPQDLTTINGENVHVIKQGVLNKNSGPDFLNAQLKIGENTFYGAIEIHVNEQDWYNHNHHLDKAYNSVVLHVCFSANKQVKREDGTITPTVFLKNRIENKHLARYAKLLKEKQFIPCENQIDNIKQLDFNLWLDRMLAERIELKYLVLKDELIRTENDWNQTLYFSVLRTFGMPVNTFSFEELAHNLSYHLLSKHTDSLFQLEALLFGVAGLLSEDKEIEYYKKLKSEYLFLKLKYDLNEINTSIKMGRMRPMNLPTIRLAQFASLIYHVKNWLQVIDELQNSESFYSILKFNISTFWQNHYSFNSTSIQRNKPISKVFANHLLLNAIVPFKFLYSKNKGYPSPEQSLELLHTIPSEKNSVLSQWKKLGVGSNSAYNSQALLHLYKRYCKEKLCLQCNIGKKLLLKS